MSNFQEYRNIAGRRNTVYKTETRIDEPSPHNTAVNLVKRYFSKCKHLSPEDEDPSTGYEIGDCCRMLLGMDTLTHDRRDVLEVAFLLNHFLCIDVCLKRGLKLPVPSVQFAMANGDLDMVKMVFEKGCVWDLEHCSREKFHEFKRYLDLLRFVHKGACRLDHLWLSQCLHYSIFDVINMVHEESCLWNNDEWMVHSASSSNLEMVRIEYPRSNNVLWTTYEDLVPENYYSVDRKKSGISSAMDYIEGVRCCMSYIEKNVESLQNKK